MRTFITKILAILVFLLIVALRPVHAQEIKVPDVHDGTWLLLRTSNYEITLLTSPTTKATFTIGTARKYQQIGGPAQVTEIMSLQDQSRPILTTWNEDKTEYYALSLNGELKIGTQLNITIDNHPCPGLWIVAYINVARSGPVQKWWTVQLTNPYIASPQTPKPSLPGPSSSKIPRGT